MRLEKYIALAALSVLGFASYLCAILHKERMERLKIEMQTVVLSIEQLQHEEPAAKKSWRK